MGGLPLADALALCGLLAACDPKRYERAALRWLQRVRVLVLAAVLSLMLASARSAQAAPIACGNTITASVKLTADLVCSGDGLVVLGDNTVVNFEGHSLTGHGTGTGIITAGESIFIKNGTIQNFAEGAFDNFSGSTFLRMNFNNNGQGV